MLPSTYTTLRGTIDDHMFCASLRGHLHRFEYQRIIDIRLSIPNPMAFRNQAVHINGLIEMISVSSSEQGAGLREMNTSMYHMDEVTQQNAAMVEETTAASVSLRDEAARLKELVARFNLSNYGTLEGGGKSLLRTGARARGRIVVPSQATLQIVCVAAQSRRIPRTQGQG